MVLKMIAGFSNYGKNNVDIYAGETGDKIYATTTKYL